MNASMFIVKPLVTRLATQTHGHFQGLYIETLDDA